MIEEAAPHIHRIEVPLPGSPLKAVNCYVIKGPDRDLVIDTGMNRSECKAVMEAGLRELDVDLNKTDFFITHLHSDHMGLISHFATETSKVYFNAIEAKMINEANRRGGFAPRMLEFARIAGFSETECKESLASHPGLKYHSQEPIDFTIMGDGDTLEIGDYRFVCIHTPGHSPGHLCLYDEEKRLMISGDHVLGDISPNISSWTREENPLEEFLESLEAVRPLEVDLALPGHRTVIRNFRGRVDELIEHHGARLDEVKAILDGASMPAYEIASRMTWNMKAATWDEVGIMQKWFATGEAVAHLRYLEERGVLQSQVEDGVAQFYKA